MIDFEEKKNIYIYSEQVDMRMGMRKIQLMVAINFKKEEIKKSVYVFCSRDKKQIKLYYEDEYGCWLIQNKLHEGGFKWPKLLNNIKITKEQLKGLCKGLEMIESERPRRGKYEYY